MPMRKFALVREAIERAACPRASRRPSAACDEDLLRVHAPAYIRAIATGEPRALAESQKFPWSPALAGAVRFTNGGCVAAAAAALEDGVAGNLASGFHHAHEGHGEGFCTFNGLVVALERARAEAHPPRPGGRHGPPLRQRHRLAARRRRPGRSRLSIYGSWYKQNRAYRDVEGERARTRRTRWSVPVPAGARRRVPRDPHAAPRAGDRPRPPRPDPHQAARTPSARTLLAARPAHDDLYARDAIVFRAALERGVPIAWVLAGGYTPDVSRVVEVHLRTFIAAARARAAARPG